MRFFPVFLDLAAGTVVLVGSTKSARAKLRLLRAAGARVRWYVDAPAASDVEPDPMIDVMAMSPAQIFDLSDALAVVAAAGDPTDLMVAAQARARRIPLNVVDRPKLSTFIVPAIVDRGDVVVAIGTGGAAPVLARRLRERIEALMPARIGELAALMGRYRERLVAALSDNLARRRFWERVVDGPIAAAALSGRGRAAEADLARAIGAAAPATETAPVHLVGAGPGDPDLLTLRALQVLQSADEVLYDELVTDAVLDRARRDAVRVFVGARGGQPPAANEIARRLATIARDGRRAVRLTGGDGVMPDGDAELDYLRRAGVPVVVVPGIGGNSAVRRAARDLEAA